MGFRLDRGALVDAVRRSAGFRTIARRMEDSAVKTARDVANDNVERRSGEYLGGFRATFTPAASKSVLGHLRLFNPVEHAEFIEKGTRPHLIRVRNAKVLVNSETGQFFGVQVNHPGTQPRKVIDKALRRVAGGRGL